MELRQLRYFKIIADKRSFARAAQYLCVAQPALSRSIAKLENEIGQLLFVRHSGGVALTDAGARFYDHANSVLREVQILTDDMAAEMGIPHGVVALGMPASLQFALAVPVVAKFLMDFPRVTLNIVQETSLKLRDEVLAGHIDVAVISTRTPSYGLRCLPLLREGMCLVQRADSEPRFGSSLSFADLVDIPLLVCGYPNTLRLSLEMPLPSWK